MPIGRQPKIPRVNNNDLYSSTTLRTKEKSKSVRKTVMETFEHFSSMF